MATLRKMKSLLEDKGYKERIDHAIETSTKAGWTTWFGEYPVPHELRDVMVGVSKVMPYVKFYPATLVRKDGHQDDDHYIINEFSVYMDDYPFDFGRVGYKNYSVKKDYDKTENSFGIYSRKIKNPKYGEGRDQFHMVMTASPDKAVKMASKYLVPYTHRELAQAFYKGAQNNIAKSAYDAINERTSLANNVGRLSTDILLSELANLKSQGVKFKHHEFAQVIDKLDEVEERAREEQSRRPSALFVRFRQVGDDTYADVQNCADVRSNDYKPNLSDAITTYIQADIPEDIMGSVAVLSILEDGQYVNRVGQKVDERTFWIERG